MPVPPLQQPEIKICQQQVVQLMVRMLQLMHNSQQCCQVQVVQHRLVNYVLSAAQTAGGAAQAGEIDVD